MSGGLSYPITPGMRVVDVSENGGVIAGITEDSVIYRPFLDPEGLLVGRWTDVAVCGLVPARNVLPESPDDRTRQNAYAHLLEQLLMIEPWTDIQRALHVELVGSLCSRT